ncbi:MAG: acyl carrier protein [Ignavibacteria bacterium]|nr:acyl carrier protein [Ignavibacteria bacterium]
MDRTEVENRVKKVIAGVLKINQENISSSANFIFDLGADSLQSLQLVAGFEEEFDIEMDEDAALGVQSVSDAVSFIKSYVDAKV